MQGDSIAYGGVVEMEIHVGGTTSSLVVLFQKQRNISMMILLPL